MRNYSLTPLFTAIFEPDIYLTDIGNHRPSDKRKARKYRDSDVGCFSLTVIRQETVAYAAKLMLSDLVPQGIADRTMRNLPDDLVF
jgi:hypothetical protein